MVTPLKDAPVAAAERATRERDQLVCGLARPKVDPTDRASDDRAYRGRHPVAAAHAVYGWEWPSHMNGSNAAHRELVANRASDHYAPMRSVICVL